jgi:thiamine biosynthesis protein ThiS
MNITLNGESSTVREGASVAELLAERKLIPLRVAVEVNEELVPRKQFAETALRDGDRIEIVTFVGGG